MFLARRLGDGGRPVVLAATVGEEGLGNLRGARGVVDALAPSEFIALEGGGARQLVTQGVGSARLRLTATTAGGHSWQDRGRPSALHRLIGLLAPLTTRPGTASFNVGELHGGAGINVLAPEAHATVEFRDLDTARLDAAVTRLEAAAAAAEVAVETLGRRPGGTVAGDHPLVRDALGAFEAAGAARPALAASSTDANAALGAGIPAVTVGLAESSEVHAADEYVDVSGLSASLSALAGPSSGARRTVGAAQRALSSAQAGSAPSMAASACRWRSVMDPIVFVSDIGIDARNLRHRVRPQRCWLISRSAIDMLSASQGQEAPPRRP